MLRLLFLDLVTVTYILLLFYPFLLLFLLALPRGSVFVLSLLCQIEMLSLTESFIQNVETEYIGSILAL
jgi:hypothetical protein